MLREDNLASNTDRAPSAEASDCAADLAALARARRLRARRAGMTLIEIMIVVVIMALVATGVGIAVLPQLERSRIKSAESAVATVRSAVELHLGTSGTTDCPTMAQLVEEKTINKNTATTDPWGREFRIQCDGTDITVVSAGPDGEFDSADDIPKQQSR